LHLIFISNQNRFFIQKPLLAFDTRAGVPKATHQQTFGLKEPHFLF
jgi:hypothetical protein